MACTLPRVQAFFILPCAKLPKTAKMCIYNKFRLLT